MSSRYDGRARALRAIRALPKETLILPSHASMPPGLDSVPLAASLAEVEARPALLSRDERSFVAAVVSGIPDAPPSFTRIGERNERGDLPGADAMELEAGANRCAVG